MRLRLAPSSPPPPQLLCQHSLLQALTRLRDALRDRPRDATVDASEMAEDAEARADVESKGGDAPLAPGEMAPSADESVVESRPTVYAPALACTATSLAGTVVQLPLRPSSTSKGGARAQLLKRQAKIEAGLKQAGVRMQPWKA